LGVSLAAVAIAVGSGANFTAQSANPNNTFSSGSLTMSNSKDNQAILSADNMKPGDSAQGMVDIENTGSVGGAFSLNRRGLTDSNPGQPMSAKLNVVVRDCGTFSSGTPTCDGADPVAYQGTLAAMSGSQALGSYGPSDKHRYEFTVVFDSSADNSYRGASASATFEWDAVQS
jgi:hypothetical protein